MKTPWIKASLLSATLAMAGLAHAVPFITIQTAGIVQDDFFNANFILDYNSNAGLTVYDYATPSEGSTVTYSPLSATTGLTALTLEHHLAGIRHSSSDAIASGDLATGKIRVYAASGGDFDRITGGATSALVRLYDTLHFSVQGASGTVTLRAHVDGAITLPDPSDHNWGDALSFGSSQFTYNAADNRATSNFGYWDGSGNPTIQGWDSFSTGSESLSGHDFTGTFTVHDGDVRAFSRQFSIYRCYTHAVCDFFNTASFSLELSGNVSYTSDSGVFLSAAAVPEPATYALMLVGLAATGWARARRAR